MEDNFTIRIENITKIYKGSAEPALKNISLEVPQNEIFGLLGPNGAGKTTTINILCGFLKFNSGKAYINDWSVEKDMNKIKRIVGLVPQDIALYKTLSAWENLRFIGNMYGLKGNQLKARINECLNMLGLEKSRNRQIKTYSGGMKRRINLIAGILHEPEILFLDEPTVGIDVQSRKVIMDYLHELNKNGTTIIYTSHYLEEAEKLCSSIAIIDNGEIITQGNPGEMIESKEEYTDLESIFIHLTGRSLRDN
jgi:ABC-2 type transport system ATP-binding protein